MWNFFKSKCRRCGEYKFFFQLNSDNMCQACASIKTCKECGKEDFWINKTSDNPKDLCLECGEKYRKKKARKVTIRANEDVPTEMQDVVSGYTLSATLDEKTCLECLKLDGKLTNRVPPLHDGCRCIRLPKTKTYKELGLNIGEIRLTKRASAIGPIAGNAYREYLIKRAESIENGTEVDALVNVLRGFVDKLEKKYPDDKDEVIKIKKAVFSESPTNDVEEIESLLGQINWPSDPWDLIAKCADMNRDDIIEKALYRMAGQIPHGEYRKKHREQLFRKAADSIKKNHPHLSIKYYIIAAQQNPQNTAGMVALAKAYKRAKDKENAKIWFGKALEVNPDHKGAKKEYDKL